MPSSSYLESCITENSVEKEEHKQQIADAFLEKESNMTLSLLSSKSSESKKDEVYRTLSMASRTTSQILGTDFSQVNRSVHYDDGERVEYRELPGE